MGIRVTDPDLLRRLNRRDDEEEERERFDLTPSAPVVPGGKRVTDPDLLNLLNKKREPVAPDASLAPMGDQILGDPMSYYGGEAGGNIGSGGLGAMVGKMAEGVTRGGAAMTRGVSDVVDYLGRKAPGASGLALDTGLMLEDRQTRMAPGTFLPQQVNQAIDKGIDIWVESADYWKDYAEKHGAGPVDEIFGQATGGAIPGIGEFIMGPFYAAAKEAAAAEKRGDSELAAMIKGGIKRYLMGRILHSTGELNLPLRTGALGTVGAVEGYAETGDVGEAVKGGMILGGMGLVPFGERPRLGGMGTRDVLSRWAEPGRGIPEPTPTPQFQSPERQRIWEIERIARQRAAEADPRLLEIYPNLEDWIAEEDISDYATRKMGFDEPIVTGERAEVTPAGIKWGVPPPQAPAPPGPETPDKTHFFSGIKFGADFEGVRRGGGGIGAEFFSVTADGAKKLQEASKTNRVFLDNGAFTIFMRNVKAKTLGTDKEIKSDWDAVLRKYIQVAKGSENPSNLYFVLPDVIGNAKATMFDQARYAMKFAELAKMGVNIIVPVQKGTPLGPFAGETTGGQHFRDINAIYGGNAIVGIPTNKEAWNPQEAGLIARELGAKRVHLLGRSPGPTRYAEYSRAIRGYSPNVEIFSDAVPSVFFEGKVGRAVADKVRGEQEGWTDYDDTELNLNYLSKEGLIRLWKETGLEEYLQVPAEKFAEDAISEDGLFNFDPLTQESPYEAMLADANIYSTVDQKVRELLIEAAGERGNRGLIRQGVMKETVENLLATWKEAAPIWDQPPPPKAKKGKKEPVRPWGKGKLSISAEEWKSLNVMQNGLAPFFTTKTKGAMKADKAISELIERGILREGATLDDLVDLLQSRKGAAGAVRREAGTVRGEEAIAEAGEEYLARQAEEEAALDEEIAQERPITEISQIPMYRGEAGDEKVGAFGNTKLALPTFTDNPTAAGSYATEMGVKTNKPYYVRKSTLAVNNPIDLRVGHEGEDVVSVQSLQRHGFTPDEIFTIVKGSTGWRSSESLERGEVDLSAEEVSRRVQAGEEVYTNQYHVADSKEFVELTRGKGYDGSVINGTFHPFDSEQAESLRDNNDYVMEVRPYSAEQIKDYGVPEQPKAPTPTGRFIVQGMQVIDTTTGNVAKTGRDPAALQKVADALNAKAAPPAPTAPKAPKAAPMPEGTPSWVPYQTTRGGAIYKTPEGSYVLVNEGSDAFQDYDGEKVAAFYVRPTKTTGKITYKRYKGIKFGTLEEVNAQLAERAKKMGWELVTESNPPTDYDRIDQFTREAYQRIRANPQLAEYEVRQLVKQELEKETGFWEGSRTVDSYYINALEGIAPTTREEIFAKEPAAEKEPSLPGVKEQEQFRLTAPERPAGAPEGEFETPAGGEQETLPGMKPRIEDMKKKRPEAQGEGPLFDVIEEIGRGVPGKEEKQPGLSIRAVAMATDVTPTGEKYEFGGSVNPEVNQRWADSDKGLAGDVTFWQRAKSWATRVKNEFTRAHVLLEKRRFAVPLEILRWYDATVGVSKKSAVNMVYGIVGRLGPEKSKLFTRLLILPDLIRDVDRGLYRWPEIEGKKYPWGYESVDEMRVDLARFEQEARNLPDVQEALAYRSRMVKQLVKELVANDLLSEEALTNPDYYHHQVLERMRAEDADLWKGGPFSGVSSRDVRPHTKGFQIGRKGSVKDYNTRYIEAEYEWFAQAISQLRTKYALDRLDAAENVYGKVIAEAQRRWGDTRDPEDNRLLWRKRWKELIDEMYPGYKVWQPKPGNWFWRGRTITERTLDQILVDGIKEIVVRGEDYMILDTRTGEMKPLGDSLILGGRNQEWVIPKELADTLNTYREFGEQSFLERGSRAMLQGWKQYILFNPVRALKYLTNNTTGDLDVTFAYDPAILKYVNRKDIGDLYNYFVRRRGPTKDILEAESHDVVGGITIAEIAEIGRESVFRDIVSPRPMRAIRYFEFVRDFNAFRESILRMAAYKYFKDRLSKGEVHYGASDAGQIRKLMQQPMEGLWDKDMMIKTVAAKLSRELVGDYGNISAGGRWLRQHMIPFYSWLEINAPRYYRMMKNAATEGGPATFGETFARKGAGSLARFFVQALTLYGAVNVWNYMMFPEENRKLNGQKGQLHLILHKDRETGKVTSIRFQGALSDALGWFGLESVGTDIQGLREGDLSPQEKLTEMAKAPAEKLWMGIRPEKTVAETIVGRTTYPNLFSRSSWRPGSGARPIRDPGEALSRLVSMDVPYRYARGLPTRGVGHDLTSLLLYRSDPGERAYQNIRNEAMDFLEQRGRTKPSTTYTPKTLALYYYKQAIQMGDSRAEERWLNKYISEGGTAEAMERSVKAGTPENWIPKDLRDEFIYSLTPRQLQDFGEAIEWWERVYGY